MAIPIWVKNAIDAWMTAGGIDKGRLLRSVSKSGKLNHDSLSDSAVWSIVEESAKQIGIEHFGAPTTCAAMQNTGSCRIDISTSQDVGFPLQRRFMGTQLVSCRLPKPIALRCITVVDLRLFCVR